MSANIIALTVCAGVASAAAPKPLSQQDFNKLTHDGKPVVVDVSAGWCTTCKAQKPIVENLFKQLVYKDVAILTLDFDADKAIVKQFKVNMQSILIAFKGGKEIARSVGDTTHAGIEGIFKKAAN